MDLMFGYFSHISVYGEAYPNRTFVQFFLFFTNNGLSECSLEDKSSCKCCLENQQFRL